MHGVAEICGRLIWAFTRPVQDCPEVRIHICICICIGFYTYIYTYMHTCMHANMHANMHAHVYIYIIYVYTHMFVCIYVRVYTDIHVGETRGLRSETTSEAASPFGFQSLGSRWKVSKTSKHRTSLEYYTYYGRYSSCSWSITYIKNTSE